jgi:hypothetical protein
MTMRPEPIVGTEVADQSELRRPRPVRDLDEFLEFLTQLEAIFGPIETPRVLTTGDRFLL